MHKAPQVVSGLVVTGLALILVLSEVARLDSNPYHFGAGLLALIAGVFWIADVFEK